MKKRYQKLSVVLAAGLLCAAATAFAQEHEDVNKTYSEEVTVSLDNDVNVSVTRRDSISKDIMINGQIEVMGRVPVSALTSALVDDKQMNYDNHVDNNHHVNDAIVDGNALRDASGNIGLNIAAGDNNLQDNAAAIAAADAYFVFGAADAAITVNQDTLNNHVMNNGNMNTASLGGAALMGASGNIGVNIAAGNSNLQKNNLAAAVAPARLGTATVAVLQQATGNHTVNQGGFTEVTDRLDVQLFANLGQSENSSANIDGGYGGSYTGVSDQIGDFYPDIWTDDGSGHPMGSTWGHMDIDNQAQGAVDLNSDGGGLAFNEDGTMAGGLVAELTNLQMNGMVSGAIYQTSYLLTPTVNTANLGGNALRGATGNIGVNIAAGTNNVQNNSMAMVATSAPVEMPMLVMPGGGNILLP